MASPISGEMLNLLKATLGTKTSSLLWLFGWGSPQWSNMSKRGPNELPGQHSLMIRLLMERPDLSPIPTPPSGQELYDLLSTYDPTLTPREFAVLLGLEPGSKDRLLDDFSEKTSTVNHYMMIIKNELEELKTKKQKVDFVKFLREIAEEEAEARGLSKSFWKEGGWRKHSKDDQGD